MWHSTFDQRLAAWNQLRTQCANASVDKILTDVNDWWFDTPWRAYHLHWDDQATWPSPWELLDDNLFCSLARGLGILYTIAMIDHPLIQDAELVDTGSDNLVLVGQKKYILNWDRQQVLNINLTPFSVQHSVGQEQIKIQIK
jgi:hypothetical protein